MSIGGIGCDTRALSRMFLPRIPSLRFLLFSGLQWICGSRDPERSSVDKLLGFVYISRGLEETRDFQAPDHFCSNPARRGFI